MDILNITFGLAGVIGAVFSVYGAIESNKGSKKAERYLNEIKEKKSAFDLGILNTRVDNLQKDVFSSLIARRTARGVNKEFDKYRQWCDEITIILNEIPTEMKSIVKNMELAKEIIISCIISQESLYDAQYDGDSSFKKIVLVYLEMLLCERHKV